MKLMVQEQTKLEKNNDLETVNALNKKLQEQLGTINSLKKVNDSLVVALNN